MKVIKTSTHRLAQTLLASPEAPIRLRMVGDFALMWDGKEGDYVETVDTDEVLGTLTLHSRWEPSRGDAESAGDSTSEPQQLDPVLTQLHRYMERYEGRRGATTGQQAVLDAIQNILDGGQVAWAPSDDRRES